MDFKLTFPGGEPNISNPDLMFTQYSNQFAIHAIGTGIDKYDEGFTVSGCEFEATYNPIDDTITCSISDGYIMLKGKVTKVVNTSVITFANSYFYTNARKPAYIYAEKVTTYNVLGDKQFEDGTNRQTWQENRIQLSQTFSETPEAGKILIAKCYVNPSDVLEVTDVINDISEQVIENTSTEDITTTEREGKNNKSVSRDDLYQVMGNQTILNLTSNTKTLDGSSFGYLFTLPTGLDYRNVFLLSAKIQNGLVPNVYHGCAPSISERNTWVINGDTNQVIVYFPIGVDGVEESTSATALISISKV